MISRRLKWNSHLFHPWNNNNKNSCCRSCWSFQKYRHQIVSIQRRNAWYCRQNRFESERIIGNGVENWCECDNNERYTPWPIALHLHIWHHWFTKSGRHYTFTIHFHRGRYSLLGQFQIGWYFLYAIAIVSYGRRCYEHWTSAVVRFNCCYSKEILGIELFRRLPEIQVHGKLIDVHTALCQLMMYIIHICDRIFL